MLGLISAGLFVQGVVVAVLGVETKGMALEDVSEETGEAIPATAARRPA